jgi:hypothetical protein
VLAFAPAHEEQGRRTLHSHWQIWTEDLSTQVREDLWNRDRNIRKKSREAFYRYVDEVMTATYSKPLAFTHNCCKRIQGNVTHDVTHADNDDGVQDTHPKCNIDQHDIETNNNHHMSDASVIRNSVDDLTYELKNGSKCKSRYHHTLW